MEIIGAGNEARTRDLNLGKVALYQLSYSRPEQTRNCRAERPGVKNNRPSHPGEEQAVSSPNGAASEPSAAAQFRPRHAQILDHGPEREDRRHGRQHQSELIGRNTKQVLPVQQHR
jgi:hypothetical protein